MSRLPGANRLEHPTTDPTCITERDGGIRVRVRLTPKSARDALEGEDVLSDGTTVLIARVRAVPEDGAANAALELLLAKATGVARTRVSVVSGATSRVKIVEIEGDPADLTARLQSARSKPLDFKDRTR